MQHYRSDDKSKGIFEYIKKHTPALQIGTLIHAHLLTPEIIPDLKETVFDLMKRFPAKENKHGAVQDSALDRIDGAIGAARANPELMQYLEGTKREYAGMLENFLGSKVRIKADAIDFDSGIVLDVKTSTKSFNQFKKDVLSDNPAIPYRIQAALYVMVANEINKICKIEKPIDRFVWLFVQSKAPFKTGVLEISKEALDKGKQEVIDFFKGL